MFIFGSICLDARKHRGRKYFSNQRELVFSKSNHRIIFLFENYFQVLNLCVCFIHTFFHTQSRRSGMSASQIPKTHSHPGSFQLCPAESPSSQPGMSALKSASEGAIAGRFLSPCLSRAVKLSPNLFLADTMKQLIKSGHPYIVYRCKLEGGDVDFHGPVSLQILVKYFNHHPDWRMGDLIHAEYGCSCGFLL